MFDTLDQPSGELLLRDGFALVSSSVGDEELSFVLAPDVASTSQTLRDHPAQSLHVTPALENLM